MVIKPFKIKVTPEQSIIVQKFLFSNDYEWVDGGKTIQYLEKPYLYFTEHFKVLKNKNFRLESESFLTQSDSDFSFIADQHPELLFKDVIKLLRKDKIKQLNNDNHTL